MELIKAHQTECQPYSQKEDNVTMRTIRDCDTASHSPSKHATSEHKEDANHYMIPKFGGARLWHWSGLLRGCDDGSSDSIPDERQPQCAANVQQQERGGEGPHSVGRGDYGEEFERRTFG